jgi:CDP-diacylglycerol--glycerol-3-phosphate 3-phosphatidyltransferase
MPESSPITFTDQMRQLGYGIINPIGKWLYKLGIHPDLVTIVGCGLVLLACVPIAQGQLPVGAILLLLALPCDVLDGAVARAMERKGQFGAVLDSSLDRYADGFIFAALSYYFAVQGRMEWIVVAQAALLGTFMVSYLRARAEGVGVIAKIGLLSRMERSLIIIPMLLFPVLLEVLLLVLAIGTNLTTLQRLWFVYRTLRDRGE